MKKIKRQKPASQRPSRTRLGATAATSAAALALPVLLATAPSPLMAEAQPAPVAAEQRLLIFAELDEPGDKIDERGDQPALDKYFLEGYNYCDAKVLAAYWREPTPYHAKVSLGRKMLASGPAALHQTVNDARGQALAKPLADMPCWYTDGGFSYDDVELLSKYWGNSDITEVKYKMTGTLIAGSAAHLQGELSNARAGRSAP